MSQQYRGDESGDEYNADELGIEDDSTESITMGNPQTGVTERFVPVDESEDDESESESEDDYAGTEPGEAEDVNPDAEEFFETDEESESDEQEEEPTCAGNDGECSRTVDEEGERCWQHQPGDE